MTTATSDPWDAPVDVTTAAQLAAYGITVLRDPRRQRYVVACGDLRVSVARGDVIDCDAATVFRSALMDAL